MAAKVAPSRQAETGLEAAELQQQHAALTVEGPGPGAGDGGSAVNEADGDENHASKSSSKPSKSSQSRVSIPTKPSKPSGPLIRVVRSSLTMRKFDASKTVGMVVLGWNPQRLMRSAPLAGLMLVMWLVGLTATLTSLIVDTGALGPVLSSLALPMPLITLCAGNYRISVLAFSQFSARFILLNIVAIYVLAIFTSRSRVATAVEFLAFAVSGCVVVFVDSFGPRLRANALGIVPVGTTFLVVLNVVYMGGFGLVSAEPVRFGNGYRFNPASRLFGSSSLYLFFMVATVARRLRGKREAFAVVRTKLICSKVTPEHFDDIVGARLVVLREQRENSKRSSGAPTTTPRTHVRCIIATARPFVVCTGDTMASRYVSKRWTQASFKIMTSFVGGHTVGGMLLVSMAFLSLSEYNKFRGLALPGAALLWAALLVLGPLLNAHIMGLLIRNFETQLLALCVLGTTGGNMAMCTNPQNAVGDLAIGSFLLLNVFVDALPAFLAKRRTHIVVAGCAMVGFLAAGAFFGLFDSHAHVEVHIFGGVGISIGDSVGGLLITYSAFGAKNLANALLSPDTFVALTATVSIMECNSKTLSKFHCPPSPSPRH